MALEPRTRLSSIHTAATQHTTTRRKVDIFCKAQKSTYPPPPAASHNQKQSAEEEVLRQQAVGEAGVSEASSRWLQKRSEEEDGL